VTPAAKRATHAAAPIVAAAVAMMSGDYNRRADRRQAR
jgi:hypothetical protein